MEAGVGGCRLPLVLALYRERLHSDAPCACPITDGSDCLFYRAETSA